MNAANKNCLLIFFGLFCALIGSAQKESPITLQNPSFEDVPGASHTPIGWFSCGQVMDSPPDVQPGGDATFGVSKPANHGSTYIGMVVRDDETWESVGQRLSRPLEKGQCYEFSMDLARSEAYTSQSRLTGLPANFNTPARLIIWGGNGFCDKQEVLFETGVIAHPRWLTYNFRLHPKKGNWSHIMFEAYYRQPTLFPYNGNIMLDNASSIRPIQCNPEPMIAAREKEKPKPPVNGGAKGGSSPKNTDITKVDTPKVKSPEPPVSVEKLGKNMKKGRVYRLDKVYFDADKYDIKPECEVQLEELYTYLRNNNDVVIEIGGHTNNLLKVEKRAIELSTNRAKSVADWLISKGIASSRVQYVGYGWKHPIEPNTTLEGRKKNQRVEVKILGSNG
jgi:outer membrane protein OmpA-like peptidoglycan-associated protein